MLETRLGAAMLVLVTVSLAFSNVAAALPPHVPAGGEDWIGPRPQDDCNVSQSLGFGGDATGSATGYHSYTNSGGRTFRGLDSCLGLNPSDPVAWTFCQFGPYLDGTERGVDDVVAGATQGDVARVVLGIDEITEAWFATIPPECGSIFGDEFGSDGEFEWGDDTAILNVRVGTTAQGGGGVKECLWSTATAHHGSDTTVFVQDILGGGNVGFTVAADWGRDGEPCGDGAIEPCGGAYAERLLAGDCNPLDVVAHVDALGPGADGPNSWTPGTALASFGDGGADGQLHVFLDQGPVVGGVETVAVNVEASTPTVGWVWTG